MASRASKLDERNQGRLLLAVWAAGLLVLSLFRDPFVLAGAGLALLLLFRRRLWPNVRRALLLVAPTTLTLALLSYGWLRWTSHTAVTAAPFVALALRTVLMAFFSFSVLERVDLLRATAAWPMVSRLLIITLAQIHALRLVVRESSLGLRSRTLRKPTPATFVRNASGITVSALAISMRNAEDISDAMRSRGF